MDFSFQKSELLFLANSFVNHYIIVQIGYNFMQVAVQVCEKELLDIFLNIRKKRKRKISRSFSFLKEIFNVLNLFPAK